MNFDRVKLFELERVLNEDPVLGYVALLGSLPASKDSGERLRAIIRLTRTNEIQLSSASVSAHVLEDLVLKAELVDSNDIYSWLRARLVPRPDVPDVKIDVICPATEVHVRKYTKQRILMVSETPVLYERVTKPYINSFDPKRTAWVDNVLSGRSEAHKVLHNSDEFIILPDMKWIPPSASDPISEAESEKMYLCVIVRDGSIKSLRDLRGRHIRLLERILEASNDCAKRFGVVGVDGFGPVRCFVHYQPNHFHVHILHPSLHSLPGMAVGQAHLLEDIISLLNIDSEIFAKMTLTYGLGSEHGLFEGMKDALSE